MVQGSPTRRRSRRRRERDAVRANDRDAGVVRHDDDDDDYCYRRILPTLDLRHSHPRGDQGRGRTAHCARASSFRIGDQGIRVGARVGLLGIVAIRLGGRGSDAGTVGGDGFGIAQ